MKEIIDCFTSDLFAGKHVIVTGATSGIGLDIARGFAALGATVTGAGSSKRKIDAISSDGTASGIEFTQLDVRDSRAMADFCAGQKSADVLVNAAGVAKPGDEWAEATFLEVMEVNLNSQMRAIFGLEKQLKAAKGSVINIASMLSYLADVNVPAYGASKTGVLGLTRSVAHAWGRDGVRVNAIAPGYHTTEMTKPIWSQPEGEAAVTKRTALGRWGTTADLVGASVFLASPAAAYITGECLAVDGGFVTGNPL
ncbi:MAG: SDR family oxidoreductase [Pseudomonadota bacterium]